MCNGTSTCLKPAPPIGCKYRVCAFVEYVGWLCICVCFGCSQSKVSCQNGFLPGGLGVLALGNSVYARVTPVVMCHMSTRSQALHGHMGVQLTVRPWLCSSGHSGASRNCMFVARGPSDKKAQKPQNQHENWVYNTLCSRQIVLNTVLEGGIPLLPPPCSSSRATCSLIRTHHLEHKLLATCIPSG